MIAFIKGRLESVSEQHVVVECSGIGYRVQASPATIMNLPPRGNEVKIHTHMQVREDGITLYGFLNVEQIHMFNLLITVTGVGPKLAQGILSSLNPQQIMLAIITEDTQLLGKAQGVGKKMAQRLVLELRDKIAGKNSELSDLADGRPGVVMASSEKQDAIDALLALGYSRSEGVRAVMEVALQGMSAEQIIKLALKKLVIT